MNYKEAGFDSFAPKKEGEVNPEIVLGSEKRVMTFVVLENGNFDIEGLNLPKEWNSNINKLEKEDFEEFHNFIPVVCNKWDFSLEKIVCDKKEILKEIVIKNNKNNSVSKIKLNENKEGKYLCENLNSIESLMIFQEVMSYYFDDMWGEDGFSVENFSYGRIICHPLKNEFETKELIIPRKYIRSDDELMSKKDQDNFIEKNIILAKKFGVNLKKIEFDEDLLKSVVIDSKANYFFNKDEYFSEEVNQSRDAIVLHNVVAAYINSLLEKNF